jgi:hypothetical protein
VLLFTAFINNNHGFLYVLTVTARSMGSNKNHELVSLKYLGYISQYIKNTWKVMKCGAGEGWRRSVGPIM